PRRGGRGGGGVETPARGGAPLARLGRGWSGARQRVEQRREEQTLVDRAHPVLARAVGGLEAVERALVAAVPVAEHTRQAGARPDVGRERVGLPLVPPLQPALGGSPGAGPVARLSGVVLLGVSA